MKRSFVFLFCLLSCFSIHCFAQFAQVNGVYYHETDGGVKLTHVSSNCTEILNKGTLTIPDTVYGGILHNVPKPVVAIGEEAFLYVKDKTFKLQGGNLVERIEERAFKDCTKMTGFIETKSLSYIGCQAFSNCDALWAINILPEYYDMEIDEAAFSNCDILSYVCFGYRVKKIGDSAFINCRDLGAVVFKNGSRLTSIGNSAFFNTLTYAISIPDKVTSIGDYAFYNTSIQSVTIGLSVKTIGKDVFKDCNQLANVTWNAKLMDLSQTSVDVFNNMESIKTFSFGDKVEDIPANLCQGCKGITSITIPKSVSSVGNKAFANCRGLKDVVWKAEKCSSAYSTFDGLPNITSFTFTDGVKMVPAYLCQYLSGLIQINLPKTVESIGTSAFEGCVNLKNLYLCVAGQNVGVDAFKGCSSLSSIHNSFNRQQGTMRYCSDDSDITSYGHSGQFDNNVFKTCTLYVPNGLLEEYKKLYLWHHFVNMIEESSDIEDIISDNLNVVELERYDINGRMLHSPQSGINIVRYSDGSVRKVFVPNNYYLR